MQCEIKQLDAWRWRCHLQSGLFAAGFVWRVYDPASPPAIPRVVLHPASGIVEADAAQLLDAGAHPHPARVCRPSGLIERFEARGVLAFKHSELGAGERDYLAMQQWQSSVSGGAAEVGGCERGCL